MLQFLDISSTNHVGIDIAAASGSDIQSIQSGVVIYSGTSGNRGSSGPVRDNFSKSVI